MRRIIYIITIVIIASIILAIGPWITEIIVKNNLLKSSFCEEARYGFLGSYYGAIGTLVMAALSLYQNHRYKKLADHSESRMMQLQEDIKQLTAKNTKLIEINTRIEEAKYTPMFSFLYSEYCSQSDIEKRKSDKFSATVVGKDTVFLGGAMDILRSYNSVVINVQNSGERPVRKFICKEIYVDNTKNIFSPMECDINPGEKLGIAIALPESLCNQIAEKGLKIRTIYEMINPIDQFFQ